AAAETLELLRVAQEFYDLLQILLGLVDAGHILEGDTAVRLRQQLGLRFAESHGFAARALHLARHEDPHADEGEQWQAIDEQRHEPRVPIGGWLRGNRNILLIERLHQRRVVRSIGRESSAAIAIFAGDLASRDGDLLDVPLIDFIQQLAEGYILR